jgi:hypothetical protein
MVLPQLVKDANGGQRAGTKVDHGNRCVSAFG